MGTQDGSVPGAAATPGGAEAAADRAEDAAGAGSGRAGTGGTERAGGADRAGRAAGSGPPPRGPRDGRLLAGRYLLGDRLGRGGMGTVWRAEDRMLDREVAVKELSIGHLPEEDLVILQTRMKQEARAAARIKHPGVITIHDVLEQDGRPWIVMELIDGRSLADVVSEEGTLLPRDAADVGAQVLAALHRGHQVGVLHRDVKPANVLLESGTGRVVLTDFGIATFEGSTSLTRPGDLVGSPDYLAPERAQGHRPGPESDLWALGATLYAAVEGESPFSRPSPLSTLAAVVGEPLPEPRSAGALMPVLRALLQKDPRDRPSADEAMRMLEGVAAGHTLGITLGPPAAQRTPTQVVPVVDRTGGASDGARPAEARPGGARPAEAPTPLLAASPPGGGPQQPAPPFPAARGGHSAGTVRRSGRRRAGLLVAAALVAALLGGGVAYLAVAQRSGDSVGPAAVASPTPTASASPSDSPSDSPSASPTGGTDRERPPAPDGYRWADDPDGFRFLLPDSADQPWTRAINQGQIDYSPDGNNHYLRFSVITGQTATPLQHAETMEQTVSQSAGYQQLQLVENDYKGHTGAVWEFTYNAVSGPRHVIEQLYRVGGTEYAIYLSYPEADWKTGEQRFYTVRNSFTPTGG
ncbi:protein kinase [Streptomyces sp. NPDC092296]|uniref:serine/threonine-protein kinase n=1 Tax=Streptomyces sp. NPDC092296 TaxID=3366012 RepID=UPI0037FA17CB